ncbi:hypothetical protein [Nocardia terpenica]|uniref:hypothetical protein n=1 Tax=Nocardia terpenica TaxID=455432 RepID=UPI00142DF0D4|nr:hypothetical protein [Nocardia terpenica]
MISFHVPPTGKDPKWQRILKRIYKERSTTSTSISSSPSSVRSADDQIQAWPTAGVLDKGEYPDRERP